MGWETMQLLKLQNEKMSAEQMNKIPITALLKKNQFSFHKYTSSMRLQFLAAFITGAVPSTSDGGLQMIAKLDKRLFLVELLTDLYKSSTVNLVSSVLLFFNFYIGAEISCF